MALKMRICGRASIDNWHDLCRMGGRQVVSRRVFLIFYFSKPVAKAEGSPPGGMPRERPFFYLTTLFPFSRFEVSLPGPSFRAKNAL